MLWVIHVWCVTAKWILVFGHCFLVLVVSNPHGLLPSLLKAGGQSAPWHSLSILWVKPASSWAWTLLSFQCHTVPEWLSKILHLSNCCSGSYLFIWCFIPVQTSASLAVIWDPAATPLWWRHQQQGQLQHAVWCLCSVEKTVILFINKDYFLTLLKESSLWLLLQKTKSTCRNLLAIEIPDRGQRWTVTASF